MLQNFRVLLVKFPALVGADRVSACVPDVYKPLLDGQDRVHASAFVENALRSTTNAQVTSHVYRHSCMKTAAERWIDAAKACDASWCVWLDHYVLTAEALASMRSAVPQTRHAVFNWDACRGSFVKDPQTLLQFDVAFVTDAAKPFIYSCPTYTLYPPVQADWFRPMPGVQKDFDVSFALTNYYDGVPHVSFSRRSTVEELSSAFQKRFGLFLHDLAVRTTSKEVMDASYVGFIYTEDLPWMINASTVCLCLHGHNDVAGYVNERLAQLLVCGANVLVDDVNGLRDLLGDAVTYLRPNESVSSQVNELLHDDCGNAARRQKARELGIRLMSSETWAKSLCSTLASRC